MKTGFFFTLFLLLGYIAAPQAPAAGNTIVIGFWNLENLYDTLDDPIKNDDDFLPGGSYRWTGERYRVKIDRLSEVISLMGTEADPLGPSLLGVCEAENGSVLSDLIKSPRLAARGYSFVLVEGPDVRGVDPGLLFRPAQFGIRSARSFAVRLPYDTAHRTRDILCVTGVLMGEPVCVLVNHWPSRRGGELASRPNRIAAARMARRIADSVQRRDVSVKVILMGDFNDDPESESIEKYIGTNGDRDSKEGYYNPMNGLYRKGIGTLAWQDSWNLFDQIILSRGWVNKQNESLQFSTARIFNRIFLRSDHGYFKGYPFRTYNGGNYSGGYSDHFPSYILITSGGKTIKK
jgi:hypothetical protein